MIEMESKFIEEETTNTYADAFSGRVIKNGQLLASGNYYYIIDLGNDDKVLKGTVTIVR